jgi:hypothetical protein
LNLFIGVGVNLTTLIDRILKLVKLSVIEACCSASLCEAIGNDLDLLNLSYVEAKKGEVMRRGLVADDWDIRIAVS